MKRDREGLAYAWVEGDLFVDGPSAADVQQGNLQTCYLLASLASLSHQRPEKLRELIRDNGDGTYDVTLFKKGFLGRKKQTTVQVDGQLPTRFGIIQEYGRSAAHDELWVGLMEKAWAQLRGGYEEIGNMGRAADALTALTGQKASLTRLSARTDAAAFCTGLQATLNAGGLVIAASHPDARKLEGTGVSPSHSYAVLEARQTPAGWELTLQDPVGETLRMDAATFLRGFAAINSVR